MRALAITGPTASGKTALSLAVARALDCEIISCDSMQIYKGMDIGTAKATAEEQSEVKHPLIDLIYPGESYSAENYREDAIIAARDITSRGKIPLFVGGTGLYIDTVIRGGAPISPPSDRAVRDRLMREGETEEGRDRLYERLCLVDPDAAEKTHRNNLRRVVRALEIYELTGMTKTHFDILSREVSPDIRVGMITLDFHNRDLLYSRVDARVDAMISEGLVDEVRDLYEKGALSQDTTAAQAIGYKELLAYILGESTLQEAVDEIKLASRRYAKRQLTWFRHESDAVRIFVDTEDGKIKSIEQLSVETVEIMRNFIISLGEK